MQQSNPTIALLQGAGVSVVLADGSALWSFSGATLTDSKSVSNGLLAHVSGDSASSCYPATSVPTALPAFAPSPLGSQYLIAPLDMVTVGTAVWSYYQLVALDASAPLGVKLEGTGIAPFNAVTGQFVPTADLLWAGDALAFGESAVAVGNDVYAYACSTDANGNPVCYGAHVDASAIDNPAAYEFSQGAGFFTSDPSQALPVVDGPGGLSVRQHASGRWLATYIRPLDSVVKVRSAVTPLGPFSEEYDLFSCPLGTGDFCSGGNRHPEADVDANTIAVSFAAATFASESAGSRYWPRLAFVRLPDALP
jgi:hypothetical protein